MGAAILAGIVAATMCAAPNVVLISVDTLRPDHLGLYGHPFATSPNLDRLAAKSLVFEDAICDVPLTGPSFAAMMTSRYPRSTGVTRNGIRLPDDVPTVAEIFSAAGYETICVTSNWTLKAKLSGLDRGFATYDDGFRQKRYVLIKDERDASQVTERAIAHLKARDGRPFFAWFHYSDPHAPYRMHRGFEVAAESDFAGDPGAPEKTHYDSEIAYTDAEIQRLIRAFPAENTFIVFTSDHGESLREHDYEGHGRRLYQAGLRIPLLVCGPGVNPARSASPARGIDVGPTLLGLAGLAPAAGMRGVDLLHTPPPADRARVAEAYGGVVLKLPGAKRWMAKAGPELRSATAQGWKLISGGNSDELYYLCDDPFERHDLAGQKPERVKALRAILSAWTASVASGTAADAKLSTEDVEALESLGYAQ